MQSGQLGYPRYGCVLASPVFRTSSRVFVCNPFRLSTRYTGMIVVQKQID